VIWSELIEDTPSELGKRLAIFGVSGVAGNMFLGILWVFGPVSSSLSRQAALYKNLNGAAGLAGWQWLFIVRYVPLHYSADFIVDSSRSHGDFWDC
jgi:hypothetical protein